MATEEKRGLDPDLWATTDDDIDKVIPYNPDFSLTGQQDGLTVRRQYLVPYTIREEVFSQFLGYPTSIEVSASNSSGPVTYRELRRRLPESVEIVTDDDFKGFAYCAEVEMRPLSGGGEIDEAIKASGVIQPHRAYEFLMMTATFRSRVEDILTLDEIEEQYGADLDAPEMFRYVSWEDDDTVQFATAEHGQWVFDIPGNPPAGNKVGLPFPTGTLKLSWFDVLPECFWDQYARDIEGCTNVDEFFGYKAGTLIFTGFRRRRRKSPLGQRTVNIEFSFVSRPKGANKFIGPKGDGFESLKLKDSDPPVRPIHSAYFKNLFMPPNSFTYTP